MCSGGGWSDAMSMRHRIHIAAGERTLVAMDDFSIEENRITLLLGESGIGKSLASKALYGILDTEELSIEIDGEPYAAYVNRPEVVAIRQNGFFVFQEPSTHLHPLITLQEQISEGSLAHVSHQQEILSRLWEKSSSEEIQNLLTVYPKPYRPSGGEKQRMLLVMAFKKLDLFLQRGNGVSRALFVFDEPSGSLDDQYRNIFLEMLIERFRRRPFTALLITHDYSMIGRISRVYADRMRSMAFKELTLHDGRLSLRTFEPKDYLRWLSQLKPVEGASSSAQPILMIDRHAVVHGRKLIIAKDREAKETCSLMLHRGEMVYLKAASGVGKTTLVKAVMGLLRAEKLTVQLDGMRFTEGTPRKWWQKEIWGKKMTLVFQHADEALNAESTVKETFTALPSLRRKSDDDIRRILAGLFDDVPADFLDKRVKHLSGGQKQRLNLLRGLSLNTAVLILDEPLNGLDFESAGKVITIIQKKQKEGTSVLLISHNEEIFDRLVNSDSVYYLSVVRA